ncbi:MAG: SusD/RagB family nutrient-binding outer membrane lipoprotein [Gemmatimonadaceae bacterium]
MTRYIVVGAAAGALVLSVAACTDFLKGNKLSVDPNNPTAATADQLFVGLQVAAFAEHETTASELNWVWGQQVSGVARQWKNKARYSVGETDTDNSFSQIYGHGGLLDINQTIKQAKLASNGVLTGEAQMYKALTLVRGAAWFGNIPYRTALTGTGAKPTLDPQAQVYSDALLVIDSAIASFRMGGAGAQPRSGDFVFRNDTSKWIAAAHSLKARVYLRTSQGADSLAKLASALSEATLGISSPAGNWQTFHTTAAGEANLFYEFLFVTRNGDIEPGKALVDLLNSPKYQPTSGFTPLVAQYFTPNSSGAFVGAAPGKTAGAAASGFNIRADSPTPILTYAENQMIIAETQYRLQAPPQAQARQTLNDFRATLGQTPLASVGTQLLYDILEEKYVTNYLSLEPYQDYLRTCVPNLALPAGAQKPFAPGRFFYGFNERISNPNIPSLGQQTLINPAYPPHKFDPLGLPCAAQTGGT